MEILKLYLREILLVTSLITIPIILLTLGRINFQAAISSIALLISAIALYGTFFLGPKLKLIDISFSEGPTEFAKHGFILINHGTKTGAIKNIKLVTPSKKDVIEAYIDSLEINGNHSRRLFFAIKPQEAKEITCYFEIVPGEFVKEIKYCLELETAHGQILKTKENIYHHNSCFCTCRIDENTGHPKSPDLNCPRCGGFGILPKSLWH